MPASRIHLHNAQEDKLFYFVANVIIWRPSDGRCLLLKRSETEKVHPGKWCVPGGKLAWSQLDLANPTRMNGEVFDFEDAVERLLAREVKEEAGVEIEKTLTYINSVAFVRPDGVPSILVKFAARYKSGEVHLEQGAFTDYVWANKEEIVRYSCIRGIFEEVKTAIDFFQPKTSSA